MDSARGTTSRIIRQAFVLVLACRLAACAAVPAPASPRPDPAADRLFHADPRWLGGDAAISVPLSKDRILWLFGDSFVDPAAPYDRREAAFAHNTVAVQQGADPRRAAMRFAWGTASGAPASFFPDDGADWFWPGDGTMLPGGKLAIFLHRVTATEAGPPLGFRTAGYALVLVDNPADDPSRWRQRRIDGPALPFDALPGAAILRDGAEFVVLATRSGDGQAGLLVRWPAVALANGDLGGGLWWAGEARGWLAAAAIGPAGPAMVIDAAGAESSLHRDACGRIVHVTSRGFGATDIVLRLARDAQGPWSPPETLARPADSAGKGAFVYAGRAHPEQAGPGLALTLTYVANSFRPEDLLTPAGQSTLYWPRMIRAVTPLCPN